MSIELVMASNIHWVSDGIQPSHRDMHIKISDSTMCKPIGVAKIKEFLQESQKEILYFVGGSVNFHNKPERQFGIIYWS